MRDYTTVDRIDFDRLEEEEEALRVASPIETAMGRNASDYRNMASLFQQIIQRASAMNDDGRAFLDARGGYNTRALATWKSLISEARQILEGLSKMRNTDKITSYILEKHTRDFSQMVAAALGKSILDIIDALDASSDRDDVKRQLTKLVNRGVPSMFRDAAHATLTSSKEEFGLLN